jgi:hypothetical protein
MSTGKINKDVVRGTGMPNYSNAWESISMTIYKRKNKSFKRNITEYHGDAKCDYCQTDSARYTFSSGKLCCQSIASNCPSVRKTANRNIALRLRNEVDDNGVPKLKAKALKELPLTLTGSPFLIGMVKRCETT